MSEVVFLWEMKFMRVLLICSCAISFFLESFSQIDETKIKQHIKVLSADSLNGRGTGSEGERMAAVYIESQFKKIKLKPMGDAGSYRQSFPFKGGVHGAGTEGKAN